MQPDEFFSSVERRQMSDNDFWLRKSGLAYRSATVDEDDVERAMDELERRHLELRASRRDAE